MPPSICHSSDFCTVAHHQLLASLQSDKLICVHCQLKTPTSLMFSLLTPNKNKCVWVTTWKKLGRILFFPIRLPWKQDILPEKKTIKTIYREHFIYLRKSVKTIRLKLGQMYGLPPNISQLFITISLVNVLQTFTLLGLQTKTYNWTYNAPHIKYK